MSSYSHLVDNIRALCAAVEPTATPEVAEWAGRYAELSKAANARLRRCADLLRRGFRGEAIHQADQMPALLDVVAALDFTEFPIWESICSTYNLPRPQQLSIELAGELNEAYSAQQPVEGLIRLHRIAAMASAPLPERLMILRELNTADPTTPFWRTDLETGEKVRISQLRSEVQRAIKNSDQRQLQILDKEITETNWIASVPDDLRNSSRAMLKEIKTREGISKLKAMLPALNDAYSAMSFEEASPLIDQWSSIATQYAVVVPPDLYEMVSPIETWVWEQRDRQQLQLQFDGDCESLDRVLQSATQSSTFLAQSMRDLKRTGLAIPDQLERRYRTVIRQRETAITRKKRRNMALVGLAASVVIAGVAVGGLRIYHGQEAQRYAKQIAELTTADKLDESASMVDQARTAGYGGNAVVVAAANELQHSRDAESRRKQKYADELAKISAAITDRKLPVDFAAIDKLAKTTDEKLAVLDKKNASDAIESEVTQAGLSKVQAQLVKLTELVKSAEEAIANRQLDRVLEIRRETSEVVLAMNAVRDLPDATRISMQSLQRRMDVLYTSLQQQQKSLEAVQNLINATKSADALSSALMQTSESLGNPARKAVFAETAKMLPSWQAIENWSTISARIDVAFAKNDLPALLTSRDDITRYLSANANGPLQEQVLTTQIYVEAAIRFASSDSDWRKSIVRVLQSRPMSGWMQVRSNQGVFYVATKDDFTVSVVNDKVAAVRVNYVIGETADPNSPARKETLLSAKDLLAPDNRTPEACTQGALAELLLKELDRTDLRNWQTLPNRMSKQIIADVSTDPVLRAILMQIILETQSVKGLPTVAAAKIATESLVRLQASEAAWMNPLDAQANTARDRSKAWFELSKELPATLEKVPLEWNKVYQEFRPRIAAKGVLLSGDGGIALHGLQLPDTGVLYATIPGDEGKTKWTQVGTLEKGATKFGPVARLVPDGSMVFVVANTEPDKK